MDLWGSIIHVLNSVNWSHLEFHNLLLCSLIYNWNYGAPYDYGAPWLFFTSFFCPLWYSINVNPYIGKTAFYIELVPADGNGAVLLKWYKFFKQWPDRQRKLFTQTIWTSFDGLVQERPNSIANALELRLSCTNPSIYFLIPPFNHWFQQHHDRARPK